MNGRDIFDSVIGKRLNDVSYLVHKYEGKVTEAIALTLRFERNCDISIRLGRNGVALIWQVDPLEEMDLEEYGQIEIVPAGVYDPAAAAAALGKPLQNYVLAHAPTGDVWRIELGFDGTTLYICNTDDVLTFEDSRLQ